MCSDLGSTSRCCAGYSVIGALFTLWVGVMVSTQPFFISGIHSAEHAKTSAFGAMAMFIVTFVLSIIGIYYDKAHPKAEDAPEPLEGYSLSAIPQQEYGSSRYD